jgi:hypothetical protein
MRSLTEVAVAVKFDWERDRKRALMNVEIVSVAAERHTPKFVEDCALLKRVETRFADALRLNDRLAMLTHGLDVQGLRYCVFGGWVRDTIYDLHAMPLGGPPRDIDLVVRGIEVGDLLQRLPSDVRPTIFGGVQSGAGPLAFDIWPLHETFLIHYLHLDPTFENLLQSTDFTINAALFFPPQGTYPSQIMDGGTLEALRTRTLDFNCTSLPFPVMQCARLAAYAGKLSLHLSPAVRAFMQEIVSAPSRREQVLLGLSQNYSPSIVSGAQQILHELIGAAR